MELVDRGEREGESEVIDGAVPGCGAAPESGLPAERSTALSARPRLRPRWETGQSDFGNGTFFGLQGIGISCVAPLSLIHLIWEMETSPSDPCHGIWLRVPVWPPEGPGEKELTFAEHLLCATHHAGFTSLNPHKSRR